jgi:hypothetical protein
MWTLRINRYTIDAVDTADGMIHPQHSVLSFVHTKLSSVLAGAVNQINETYALKKIGKISSLIDFYFK